MLTEDARSSVLFLDVASMLEPLGYSLVETSLSEHKGSVNLRVLCHKRDSDITTEDLEKIYNIIYPRYSIKYGRDLSLEVSSPGINRNIKDIGEFRVFTGKHVKLYSIEKSSYISGLISDADDEALTLSSYIVEDIKESGDEIRIDYGDIAKAKLDYITEAKEK